MKSLIYWISSWEWRRSASVGDKHRFICSHQYHLRCLVGSKMFGPTSWSFRWLARRENRPLFAQVHQSRVAFAEVGVVVGQELDDMHHVSAFEQSQYWDPTLPDRRSLGVGFFLPSRYNHWRRTSESPKKWSVLTWFPAVLTNYAHRSVTYLHEDFDGSNKCDICL